ILLDRIIVITLLSLYFRTSFAGARRPSPKSESPRPPEKMSSSLRTFNSIDASTYRGYSESNGKLLCAAHWGLLHLFPLSRAPLPLPRACSHYSESVLMSVNGAYGSAV